MAKSIIIEGRESILLQYTPVYHPFTEVSDLYNAIHVLRFHSLCTAGLVVLHTDLGIALLLHLQLLVALHCLLGST